MENNLSKKINGLTKNTKAKFLSEETVYEDSFLKLIKETYLLPNEKVITRDRVIKNQNKEAVIMIAETVENKYLIVIQNRIDQITSIEFPAGYIEEKESIEEAAQRELLEETGYLAQSIKVIDHYYAQLGIDSGIVNIVFMEGCIKVGNQSLGETEYINCTELTLEELEELFKNHTINSVGCRLAFLDLINLKEKENKEKVKINEKKQF